MEERVLAERPEAIPIPRSLSDRFRIEEVIGQGGFGTVYRVFEPATTSVFALKIIRLEGGFGRARREIRAALQVQHAGVIRCYEADVLDEYAYFLFELAKGSLKDLLRRRRDRPKAWAALCEASLGVAGLHAAGLVHRDLKPSNILLTEEGAKVADLGLATAEAGGPLLHRKQVVGTPLYMAPEQACGEEATSAVDIYALGVMAYTLLEGQIPDRKLGVVGAVRKAFTGSRLTFPKSEAWADPRLLALVDQALKLDPALRPKEAGKWGRQLSKLTANLEEKIRKPKKKETPPESLWETLSDPKKVGALVGVLLAGAFVGWISGGSPQGTVEAPPRIVETSADSASSQNRFRDIPEFKQFSESLRADLKDLEIHNKRDEDWESRLLEAQMKARRMYRSSAVHDFVRERLENGISPKQARDFGEQALLRNRMDLKKDWRDFEKVLERFARVKQLGFASQLEGAQADTLDALGRNYRQSKQESWVEPISLAPTDRWLYSVSEARRRENIATDQVLMLLGRPKTASLPKPSNRTQILVPVSYSPRENLELLVEVLDMTPKSILVLDCLPRPHEFPMVVVQAPPESARKRLLSIVLEGAYLSEKLHTIRIRKEIVLSRTRRPMPLGIEKIWLRRSR